MNESIFDNKYDGVRNLEFTTNIKLKIKTKVTDLCSYTFKNTESFDVLLSNP